MEVRIKNTYNIKPSKPTWTGTLPLSEWDQTGTITHTSTIHFYKPSEEWLMSSKSFIETLKHSLGDVLVHFYTLSGRVRWIGQGRLVLLCNAKGVELIEAESSGSKLSDFGNFDSHIMQFKDLVPCVDYEKPIDEIPLMFGQLTTFGCGGVCLGISLSHAVVDGLSAFHFITEWTRLARGEPLEAAPCIDTSLLRAQEAPRMEYTLSDKFTELLNPPFLIGQVNTLEERKKVTTVCVLPLAKDHVQSLKKAAHEGFRYDGRRPYSRFEIIAAHVWRSTCKARKHLHEQETGMCFVVNVRDRLHPPLPPKYFGNAVQDVVVMAKAGELIKTPLRYTCEKIRNAIEKVDNDEYVWSNIEFFKRQPDLTPLQDLHAIKGDDGEFYGNPNLGIISWLTLPIYGLDFGWGREIYVGPISSVSDGDCLILPGFLNDGSVRVAVCLQMAHIEDYKKYFYEDVISV